MYGEHMIAFRNPTGKIIFADLALKNELFVAQGAQIRALGRGMWHTMRGVNECSLHKVWRVHYRRDTCWLDAYDAAWNRTSIRSDALVPGMHFIYED
ncbi:MAG: hypothetical protein RLZZ342_144, partial [Candidatus Parcubacteria bacterium]